MKHWTKTAKKDKQKNILQKKNKKKNSDHFKGQNAGISFCLGLLFFSFFFFKKKKSFLNFSFSFIIWGFIVFCFCFHSYFLSIKKRKEKIAKKERKNTKKRKKPKKQQNYKRQQKNLPLFFSHWFFLHSVFFFFLLCKTFFYYNFTFYDVVSLVTFHAVVKKRITNKSNQSLWSTKI